MRCKRGTCLVSTVRRDDAREKEEEEEEEGLRGIHALPSVLPPRRANSCLASRRVASPGRLPCARPNSLDRCSWEFNADASANRATRARFHSFAWTRFARHRDSLAALRILRRLKI